MKISKREYTAEFKDLAAKRVKAGQSAGAVAKDLGLIEQTLRNWVKAVAAGQINGTVANGGAASQDAIVSHTDGFFDFRGCQQSAGQHVGFCSGSANNYARQTRSS